MVKVGINSQFGLAEHCFRLFDSVLDSAFLAQLHAIMISTAANANADIDSHEIYLFSVLASAFLAQLHDVMISCAANANANIVSHEIYANADIGFFGCRFQDMYANAANEQGAKEPKRVFQGRSTTCPASAVRQAFASRTSGDRDVAR